jgi:hypothetical protein
MLWSIYWMHVSLTFPSSLHLHLSLLIPPPSLNQQVITMKYVMNDYNEYKVEIFKFMHVGVTMLAAFKYWEVKTVWKEKGREQGIWKKGDAKREKEKLNDTIPQVNNTKKVNGFNERRGWTREDHLSCIHFIDDLFWNEEPYIWQISGKGNLFFFVLYKYSTIGDFFFFLSFPSNTPFIHLNSIQCKHPVQWSKDPQK